MTFRGYVFIQTAGSDFDRISLIKIKTFNYKFYQPEKNRADFFEFLLKTLNIHTILIKQNRAIVKYYSSIVRPYRLHISHT